MLWIFWFVWSLKLNIATDARSVWVKVKYRQPFAGAPSATTLNFRQPTSATTFNFLRTTLSCTLDNSLRAYGPCGHVDHPIKNRERRDALYNYNLNGHPIIGKPSFSRGQTSSIY